MFVHKSGMYTANNQNDMAYYTIGNCNGAQTSIEPVCSIFIENSADWREVIDPKDAATEFMQKHIQMDRMWGSMGAPV